jgi:hypothetical protein
MITKIKKKAYKRLIGFVCFMVFNEQVKMSEKILKEKKEVESVEGSKNDTNDIMEDNPFKDLARNVDNLDDDDKEIKKKCYIQVPLDPVTFNIINNNIYPF